MKRSTSIELPIPAGLSGFKLPRGVQSRLTSLLDQQDSGKPLSAAERRQAEGLVELAGFLSLLKLRAGKRSNFNDDNGKFRPLLGVHETLRPTIFPS